MKLCIKINKHVSWFIITLRMSGETGFGPLEEKEATIGAEMSLNVSATNIVASGFLHILKYH